MKPKHIATLFLSSFVILHSSFAADPVRLILAKDGTAMQQVTVAMTASERTRQTAAELAEHMQRITGAEFRVASGDGATGIAVGCASDFPALVTGVAFDTADPRRREDYLLRSHVQGVWLLGATEVAVRHAVWDLLHRLGCRQFFPGATWEIVPQPAVCALVVRHHLARLDADPTLDSVSCEPSDGGGWCECAACAQLGSISDRALLLTNEVARAVQARHPGKLVGQYAYNEHSAVPHLHAEPNVVIGVATGTIKGGQSMDELLTGWSQHATTLGIREYLGLQSWHHDLPGQQRGAQLGYLARTIPHFHARGARFYSAESSDNWGPCGLGYYFATRLLWDVGEATNLDAIFEDFIVNCFPASQQPMRKFYQLINRRTPPSSDDLVGRMYRLLDEARSLARDDAERARLAELVLYTRHVELWLDYAAATGPARQTGIEAVLRHSSRIGGTGMVHTLAVWQEHDKGLTLPEKYRYHATGENPWRSTEPFAAAELDRIVTQGIEQHAIADFEAVDFSRDLVPAAPLALKDGAPGDFGTMQRGTRHYWTWIDHAPAAIEMTVTTGLVSTKKGPARIALHPAAEAEGHAVAQAEVPPDKQPHALALKTTYPGLHRIEIVDGRIGTRIEFPAGRACTLACDFEKTADTTGKHDLYFYVPHGTPLVGGFASGAGRILNGSGAVVHEFKGTASYFSVPVPPGEDGRLWQFTRTGGQRVLLTVPPFLARSAAELLLPREVVQKDRP